MKKTVFLFAVLVVAAFLISQSAVVDRTTSGIDESAAPAAAVPVQSVEPTVLPGSSCEETESTLFPEETQLQLACCRDECRVDKDCTFRCGGAPGQCVMVNSCCRECFCVASSATPLPS